MGLNSVVSVEKMVEELAEFSGVPVCECVCVYNSEQINQPPIQMLADYLTVKRKLWQV